MPKQTIDTSNGGTILFIGEGREHAPSPWLIERLTARYDRDRLWGGVLVVEGEVEFEVHVVVHAVRGWEARGALQAWFHTRFLGEYSYRIKTLESDPFKEP